MYLESLNRLAKLALDANSSASGFSNPATMTDLPSEGTGWRLVSSPTLNPGVVPSRLRMTPIGVGSENDAYSFRVWALYRYLNSSGVSFYYPQLIGEYGAVLGTYTGHAGGVFSTTTKFADAVTVVKEPVVTRATTNGGVSVVFSPGSDLTAWVEIDTRAAVGHYFDFDQTTGTPTMNLLLEYMN